MSEYDDGEPGTTLEKTEIDGVLATLDHRPVEEHVAVYDLLHRRLRDQLSSAPDAGATP